MSPRIRCLLTIAAAVPVFLVLPFALAGLATTVEQLIYGFDDQPLFALMVGLVAGVVVAVVGFYLISLHSCRGAYRLAVKITLVAAAFDLAVVPIGRAITRYVEHPDRFSDEAK